MTLQRALLSALLLVFVAGCANPAPDGSPTPEGTTATSGTLSCQPIELLDPDGRRIDLTGPWITAPGRIGFFQGTNETTWILQMDDCMWGTITDEAFRLNPAGGSGNQGTLNGHLHEGFTIEAELITVVQNLGAPGPRAPIRLLIDWDATGQIQLREDRDRSVVGPRCDLGSPGGPFCSDPVILYRVEDDPLGEFRLARDAICGPLLDQANAVGALLVDYDADPQLDPNARAQLLDEIAAIVTVELAQLSALTPPDSIAGEFAADLQRREAELAELEAEAEALRRGDVAEAVRLDASILPVQQALRQFQAAHRFSDCP